MKLNWFILLVGACTILVNNIVCKKQFASGFRPFSSIHIKSWPSKSFKPFKPLHAEPWPSLQHYTDASTKNSRNHQIIKLKKATITRKSKKKQFHRSENHKSKKFTNTSRLSQVLSTKRGLLDAFKGANISIENHVHSVTIDTKPPRQTAQRRGLLDAFKGANISIENHVHSVTVDTKPPRQTAQRRGLLDAFKGANISIENHVHSVTVDTKPPRQTAQRRGLLDAFKGANISIENHVHSVTVDTKPPRQTAQRRGLLDAFKGANISIENHVHSVTVDTKPPRQTAQRRGLLDALKGANISIENHVHSQTVKSHVFENNNNRKKHTYQKENGRFKTKHFSSKKLVDVTASKRDETFGGAINLEGSNPMDVAAEIENNDKNLIPILTKENPDLFASNNADDRHGDENDEPDEPDYTISDKDDFPAEKDPYFKDKQKEMPHHREPQRDSHERHDEHRHHSQDEEERGQHSYSPLHGTPDLEDHGFPINSYMKRHPDEREDNIHMGHRWSHNNPHEIQRAENDHKHFSREDDDGHHNDRYDSDNHEGLRREEYNRNSERDRNNHGHESERLSESEREEPDHERFEGRDSDYDHFDRERDHDKFEGGDGDREHERFNEGERHRGDSDRIEEHERSERNHHGNPKGPRYQDDVLYRHNNDMGFHGNERVVDHDKHSHGHGDDHDDIFGAIHGDMCVTKKDGICMPEGHGGYGDHHGANHESHHHETAMDRMIEYQRNPFDPHDVHINQHHDEDEHRHEAVNAPIPQSILQIGIDPTNHVHYMTRDEHHDLHYDNSLFTHQPPHHEGHYTGHHDGATYHHNPHDDFEGEYSSHAVRITPHDNPHEHERHELDHPVYDHVHFASDNGHNNWDDHHGHYEEHGGWNHDEDGEGHHDQHEDTHLAYEHSHTYPSAPHQAPYVPIFTPPQRELPMFQVGHSHTSENYHNEHAPGERRTKTDNTLNTGQVYEFGNRDYASYVNQHLGDYLKQASYEYKVMGLEKKDFGIESVMAKKRKLENDAQAVLNETEILKQLQDNSTRITILDMATNNNNNKTPGNNITEGVNTSHAIVVNDKKQQFNESIPRIDKTIAGFLNNADINSLLVESDKNSAAGVRRKIIPTNTESNTHRKQKSGVL